MPCWLNHTEKIHVIQICCLARLDYNFKPLCFFRHSSSDLNTSYLTSAPLTCPQLPSPVLNTYHLSSPPLTYPHHMSSAPLTYRHHPSPALQPIDPALILSPLLHRLSVLASVLGARVSAVRKQGVAARHRAGMMTNQRQHIFSQYSINMCILY